MKPANILKNLSNGLLTQFNLSRGIINDNDKASTGYLSNPLIESNMYLISFCRKITSFTEDTYDHNF